MKYGVILAGGTGTRMRSCVPKQFILLNGTPIIIRTLQRFLASSIFDKVLIAIHKDYQKVLNDLFLQYGINGSSIDFVQGGGERFDSIQNTIDFIKSKYGIYLEDLILIHDAVRPFISRRLIIESFEALKTHEAVVAALPVVDTMLYLDNFDSPILDMPDRSKLFHGQAPDSFRLKTLYDAIHQINADERAKITGTSQICMKKGIPVHAIKGDPFNIKITNPFDMKIAEFYCSLDIDNESMCSK